MCQCYVPIVYGILPEINVFVFECQNVYTYNIVPMRLTSISDESVKT